VAILIAHRGRNASPIIDTTLPMISLYQNDKISEILVRIRVA